MKIEAGNFYDVISSGRFSGIKSEILTLTSPKKGERRFLLLVGES